MMNKFGRKNLCKLKLPWFLQILRVNYLLIEPLQCFFILLNRSLNLFPTFYVSLIVDHFLILTFIFQF